MRERRKGDLDEDVLGDGGVLAAFIPDRLGEPMERSSFLVKRWVCREQGPSVRVCEAPAAFQVSRIDDGPESEPGDKLQKTRIDDQRDSGKTRKSESECRQTLHTMRGNIKKKILGNGLIQSPKVSG